jgi:hypothetical protein
MCSLKQSEARDLEAGHDAEKSLVSDGSDSGLPLVDRAASGVLRLGLPRATRVFGYGLCGLPVLAYYLGVDIGIGIPLSVIFGCVFVFIGGYWSYEESQGKKIVRWKR